MLARHLIVCACALAALALPAAASAKFGQSFRPMPHNPADRLLSVPIDDFRYDHATRCRKKPAPGALAMQSWLASHSRGVSWGIMRCEKLGPGNYSLHAEGRAIDWHLDVRNRADRRAAEHLIDLLLAPDRAGNPFALARRMGVQEIIWNCQAWWGSEAMIKYSLCYDAKDRPKKIDDTSAHRNHVHIGLSRAGAAKRTSFWR
ncbi:MAG TPA: hypothetical protein VF752_09445 [Thermoleophilaceae bacterium]